MIERDVLRLSEDQLEAIAERAAQKAIVKVEQDLYDRLQERIYTEAGKILLPKIIKAIGILLIGSLAYLNKDLLKVL